MSDEKLNEVLLCPSLPSLPAVALRLLELTGDPDVAMSDIAKLVQQDQALAAKVLKTVNSSFYGLSTRCGSIDRAMGYLGLNTVKSLVLGFSLVETTRGNNTGFDLDAHWRRAILGATAARVIAKHVRGVDPEDAFTASLFQDIGVLACYVSMKDEYATLVRGEPHRSVCKVERDALGFDHTRVGSELAARWKLPAEISESIRFHHAPEYANSEHLGVVRVVALGALVCTCLDEDAPASVPKTYTRLAGQWYGKSAPDLGELLHEVGETGKVLAKMFGQDIGELPNTTELMARAQDQTLEHQLTMQRQADSLAREALVDGLTGVSNRKGFDTEIKRVFQRFASDGQQFGVLFFDVDRFKGVNDTFGHAAGDAILIELGRRTRDAVGEDGMVFRYGGEEFAVIVEGRDIGFCAELAERVRVAFDQRPFDLRGVDGAPDELHVTASIGVSSTDAGSPTRLSGGEQVVQEADESVYAAKSDGRNNVKVFGRFSNVTISTPAPANADDKDTPRAEVTVKNPVADDPGARRILLVEDDALAATLVITLLKRKGQVVVDWVKSGTRACTMVEQGGLDGEKAPQLVLCDYSLPGCDGHEVLRVFRENAQTREVPFFMLSGNNDQHMRDESLRRGANLFIHKDEFCADVNRWLGEMLRASTIAA